MILSDAPKVFAPVFIVGVQRSGTTLLRTMLHAHPSLCIGYECALYKILANTYGSGIPAEDAENFLNDLFAVRRFDLWGLERSALCAAIFGAGANENGGTLPYVEAIRRIAACYLQKEKPQATRFGFKNPNGIYHLDFIFELFPEARVLHMIRDPRAVLNSEKQKRTKLGSYQPKETIWTVARRHRKMMKISEAYKSDPRYLSIQYHDLVTDFEASLPDVLNFLNLEFQDGVQDYHLVARDNGFTPQKELWQHGKSVERPDPSRVNIFQIELTMRELSTMEMLCGRTLTSLPNVDRFGKFWEGLIGIGEVLFYKMVRHTSKQKHFRTPKNEPLDPRVK